MARFAKLIIGGYKLVSVKYEIPFAWCLVVDPNSKRLKGTKSGVYVSTVKSARERVSLRAIPLSKIEEYLYLLTGIKQPEWQRYREFSVSLDIQKLESKLRKDPNLGDKYRETETSEPDVSGELYTPNVIDALNVLEESGLHELVALYRMLLALESEDEDDSVELDLSDFGTRITNLMKESNQIFVNRFLVYNFLFQYVIKDIEQERTILEKIRKLDEDDLINIVLVPLLRIMRYQNVKRVPHHGPGEMGQDIRLFYKIDEFNKRIYYGAQVKVVDIHTSSKKTDGNAGFWNSISYFVLH